MSHVNMASNVENDEAREERLRRRREYDRGVEAILVEFKGRQEF